MYDQVQIACCILNLNATALLLKNKNKKKKKKYSAKWLLQRNSEGFSHKLIKEIQDEDTKLYRTTLRMTPSQFSSLLDLVKPYITKQDTNLRKCIGPAERLQVTLRYLATGETQTSLQLPFRIQQSTISKILKETIGAIYEVLNCECLKFPESESDWLDISEDFFDKWGFPNCLGAIDGKHCKIKPLKSFGSNYWCYKGGHTFIIMAIVDANYRFVYVDIGVNGRVGDAGIWLRSDIKYSIEKQQLKIPGEMNLPSTLTPSPFTFIADDAFPLTEYMLKPYSHRNLSEDERKFNHMLSRNRRVVENAFGHLANRFQVLFSPIFREPKEAIKVVLACVCLHNFLSTSSNGNSFGHLSDEEIDAINDRHYVSSVCGIGRGRKKKAEVC